MSIVINNNNDDKMYNTLQNIIKDLFNISEVTPMIQKQIQKLVLKGGMSFKEICQCLVYIDEVKMPNQSRVEKWNTIYGISKVLNVREESGRYFAQLKRQYESQKTEAQRVADEMENRREIKISWLKPIKTITRHKNPETIVFEDEDEDE